MSSRLLLLPAGRRGKYAVFGVVLLVYGFAGSLAGRFEGAQQNETSSFLPGRAESVKALAAVERFPGGETAPVLSVILSFAAALGTGVFFFNNVFGFPGVDPSLPLPTFVFLVALGIDYNSFLMARIREEAFRHGTGRGCCAASP